MMIEDKLMNPYTKWKMQVEELKKEIEESKLTTKVEDAQSLIKEGVSLEIVTRALGITPDDIEKHSKAGVPAGK
jgi:ferredoxin-fold anticodon binding domain-containing protein